MQEYSIGNFVFFWRSNSHINNYLAHTNAFFESRGDVQQSFTYSEYPSYVYLPNTSVTGRMLHKANF